MRFGDGHFFPLRQHLPRHMLPERLPNSPFFLPGLCCWLPRANVFIQKRELTFYFQHLVDGDEEEWYEVNGFLQGTAAVIPGAGMQHGAAMTGSWSGKNRRTIPSAI